MQEHGFAVGMKVLQYKLSEPLGGPGPWCTDAANVAVVQFGMQLLFQEDNGKSLWLSLEKGLLSRQLPISGGATSAPRKQSQWMGVLEKT